MIEVIKNSYMALSVWEDETNTEEIEAERQRLRDALEAIQKSDNNEKNQRYCRKIKQHTSRTVERNRLYDTVATDETVLLPASNGKDVEVSFQKPI